MFHELQAHKHWAEGGWEAARYHEEACAAVARLWRGSGGAGGGAGGAGVAGIAGGGGAARAALLAPLHPLNYELAALGGQAPLWSVAPGAGAGAARCAVWALGRALPALRAAAHDNWAPASAERVSRVLRRAMAGGAGGALLWALRLEAAARGAGAGGARGAGVVAGAVQAEPLAKWLLVRGAQLAGGAGGGAGDAGGAGDLHDLLLLRGLRLRTLVDELPQ
ncbi:hypothetical protein JYU34_017846 [Plutella xylostella]|uniref:Uncharacterized protein n=1 Tax=Plutella xylostella TaxID=51655 RepID=A0ABQ7Q2W9_PLUXY|nr:hypothetical protein JYU34_017846 [Plutella xylostella]